MTTPPKTDVPDGTKTVTVFDTNAYRNLTFGLSVADARSKAIQIRQREESLGILSLASPIVIWELISHLADPADAAYNHCLTALTALGEHNRSASLDGPDIRLALDSECIVCDALFSRSPPGANANVASLAAIAVYIRDNAPALTDATVLSNIKVFAKEMTAREAVWLNDLQKLLDHLDSGKTKAKRQQVRAVVESKAFAEFWSMIAVAHYATISGSVIGAAELDKRAEFFRTHFSGAFHLILALLKNLLGNPKVNLASAKKKRGNFLWDAGIAYLIPTHATAGAPQIQIVSGDKALIEAAASAGSVNVICPLDQYSTRLGI